MTNVILAEQLECSMGGVKESLIIDVVGSVVCGSRILGAEHSPVAALVLEHKVVFGKPFSVVPSFIQMLREIISKQY